jgi:hypothetical protein
MFGMDRHVRQRVPVPSNIQQLEEEWDNIPQATINSLINYVNEMSHQILTGFLIHASTYFLRYSVCNQQMHIHILGPNFNLMISLFEL